MKNNSSKNHHHPHTGDLDLYGNLRVGGNALFQHHALIKGDMHIEGTLVYRHLESHDKGLFISAEALHAAIPSPHLGDWALVADASSLQLWQCTSEGVWTQAEMPADLYSHLSQMDSAVVKTISVNNSSKIHPDADGNIDLVLPTETGEGGTDWTDAITDLGGRVGQLEYRLSPGGEVGMMGASLAETQQDVANLKETVGDGDFYDSPNDLLHRVAALENYKNGSLQTSLLELAGYIDQNTDRLSEIRSEMAALRAEIAQLAEEIAHAQGEPEQPERFEVANGNPGAFSVSGNPEDITIETVRNAYTVPPLHPHAPVGSEYIGTPHIWTAAEVGLLEGSTDAIGRDNVTQIEAALADETCIGFKLDKQYRLNVAFAGDSAISPSSYINGASGNGGSIILPRDFIIDGEVEGEAVGGFISGGHWTGYTTGKGNLFYTEHSLNLRKVHTTTNHSSGSPYSAYYIDCRKGIDQLQVSGCVFDDNNHKGRNYIGMYFADEAPHVDWVPVETNRINHINIDGCVSEGDLITNNALASRVVKTFRITGNTITDIIGMGVCFATKNERTYSGLMSWMSCPLWMVGNTFVGRNELVRSGADYYCGALIENSVLYSLHNRFENFIAGEYYKGAGDTHNVATYDEYFNGRQLFFANNTSLNIVYMSMYKALSGCLKAKGNGYIPSDFDDTHLPLVRYFKDNHLLLCPSDVETIWNARESSGSDDIDHNEANLALSEVMTIFLDTYTGGHALKDFTFAGNEVNALWSGTEGTDDTGVGNIMGSMESTKWPATRFTIEDNTFHASRISSVEWGYRCTTGTAYSSTWLFPLQLSPFWGTTSLHVRNNTFHVAENETVNLYVSRYTQSTQQSGVLPKPSDYVFTGNDITQGSSIRTTTLCTNPWGSHVVWETVAGGLS